MREGQIAAVGGGLELTAEETEEREYILAQSDDGRKELNMIFTFRAADNTELDSLDAIQSTSK